MPIYEFKCPKCKETFEKLWRVTGVLPAGTNCPVCSEPSPRIFSTYNFQFSPFLKELGEGRMI